MAIKTVVIGYQPKTKKMAQRIEETANEMEAKGSIHHLLGNPQRQGHFNLSGNRRAQKLPRCTNNRKGFINRDGKQK